MCVPAILANVGRSVVGKVVVADAGLSIGNTVMGTTDEDYAASGTTNPISDALNGILNVSDDVSKGIEGAAGDAKSAMGEWVPPFSAIGCGAVDFLESQRKMLCGVVGDFGGTLVNEAQKLITHEDNERVVANRKAALESGNYLDAIAANGIVSTALDAGSDLIGDGEQNRLDRLVEVGSLSVEDSFGYSEAASQYMSEESFAARANEGVVWQNFKYANGIDGADDATLLSYHEIFSEEWAGMSAEEQNMAYETAQQSLASAKGFGSSFVDKILHNETVENLAASLGISSETLDKVGDFVESGVAKAQEYVQDIVPVEVEAPDETVRQDSYSMEF